MNGLLPDFSTTTLLLGALICLTILWSWHQAPDQFDLKWLLVDSRTEKVSLFKVGQATALTVSTWGFVVLVQQQKLTEAYFGIYMACWAGANVANKWLDQKKEQ